jgi:hypothetical protein
VTDRDLGDVMLVGSMPYDDAETVLRKAGEALRGHVGFLPDGEVGERKNWVGMLPEFIYSKHPALEETLAPPGHTLVQPDRDAEGPPLEEIPGIWNFRVRPGADIVFDDLRYGTHAVESYRILRRLRDEGVVDPSVRFQLSLPATCSGIDWNFEEPDDWPRLYRAYNDRMRAEIELALTEIPADDLVVQWDVAWEFVDMAIGDKRLFSFYPQLTVEEKFQRYAAQLDDLTHGIPDETLLGFHWCYGTWGGWPMVDLGDLSLCVRMSNEAARRASRRLDYVHMPVVKRPTAEFFAPLADLQIGDTAVFLGMVHHTDDLAAFEQRRDLARQFLPEFGIAGVCGYGRVDPGELDHVLAVHAVCAQAL